MRLCKSNIGLMMGNMLKPARAMSGGLLPECCPKVLQDDTLAKAADKLHELQERSQHVGVEDHSHAFNTELIAALEERFGIAFDLDEIEADDLTRIGPLTDYVERKVSAE